MLLRSPTESDREQFLSAMLLGEEALVTDLRRFFRAPDPKQAALFLLLVLFLQEMGGRSPEAGIRKDWERHGHVKISVVLADDTMTTVR